MSAPLVQARYESLDDIANRFARRAEIIAQVRQRMAYQARNLVMNSWKGRGAARFAVHMDREVLPALQRLIKALAEGGKSTQRIAAILREAEEDAERLFKKSAVDSIVEFLKNAITVYQGFAEAEGVNKSLKNGKNIKAAKKRFKPFVKDLVKSIKQTIKELPKQIRPLSKQLKAVSKFSRGIRGVVRVVAAPIAIVLDGYTIWDAYNRDGKQFGIETQKAVGGIIGGWALGAVGASKGAQWGMSAGFAIGGPVGAGVGGFLGAVVGGIGGSMIGEEIGEAIVENMAGQFADKPSDVVAQ